ncbi:ABC transporter ATP-binding protein [Aquibacillus sediminis]|uniref:ABC transporter ATP-binding protein n=1 Tax=Aquibacillus sediminis TaxID=2574734 RepID=UPI0011085D91|nr:ABC transporter ATP-binding protein [Aquibacillus sediminis]
MDTVLTRSANKVSVKSILELKNLGKYFGGIRAVDGVDLSIREGELHCLIGPNGAGKSTIFKMIMGVYEPSVGSVYFEGKDITKKKNWERADMGLSIKMQIPGVFGELSVYDNMRIATQKHTKLAKMDEEITKLLDLMDVRHLKNEIVNNLSHGQQQWLEIAMSLACKPRLLLLDEPAAGMGPEETEFTAQLVRKLNKEGITILFIDHDMDFVRQIAQKVTVLHFGQKFAEGTISEIESNEEVVQIYLGNG